MDNFLGTWTDVGKVEGAKEILDKVKPDMDQEEKDKLTNSQSTYVFSKDGENYSMKGTSTAYPGKEESFTFSLGVPYGGQAIDGGNFKATIRMEGKVMVEEGNHSEWGDYKSYRTIQDDGTMLIKTEVDGAPVTQTMKKI